MIFLTCIPQQRGLMKPKEIIVSGIIIPKKAIKNVKGKCPKQIKVQTIYEKNREKEKLK